MPSDDLWKHAHAKIARLEKELEDEKQKNARQTKEIVELRKHLAAVSGEGEPWESLRSENARLSSLVRTLHAAACIVLCPKCGLRVAVVERDGERCLESHFKGCTLNGAPLWAAFPSEALALSKGQLFLYAAGSTRGDIVHARRAGARVALCGEANVSPVDEPWNSASAYACKKCQAALSVPICQKCGAPALVTGCLACGATAEWIKQP